MSVRKLTARICGCVVILCGMATASAQEYAPVADPFEFDPDFRWFEPIYDMDLAEMKPKKRAHYGWFATYDRLNLYGSRPELSGSGASQNLPEGLDSGWGHRYEVGFMLPEKDSGWLFSWVNNSVGEFDTLRRERGNRLNTDELTGGATNPANPFGFEAIPGISNNNGFNYRFVDVQDTLNVLEFDSYELTKKWRLEPYHYGGMLEPMVGMRWFRINDTNAASQFNSSEEADIGGVPFTAAAAEQLIIDTNETTNEAITGQLGFRYFKYRNRFMFSTDFRVFSGVNFQDTFSERYTEVTVYNPTAPINEGDDVIRITRDKSDRVYDRNDEFFLGFDVRGEVSYQLTKMFAVRAGFQLIDIERGLWRGGNAFQSVLGGRNDQDFLLVGGTFGATLNY
ncbi:MAG: hypothetical protein AAF802_08080 [Planctomycetota bacterium]